MEQLLESISDKIMETGLLTKFVENGRLAIVSLSTDGDQNGFEIIINLTIDDREDDEPNDDEWDNITEEVARYFESKKLWSLLAEKGWQEDVCDGFDVKIELGQNDSPGFHNTKNTPANFVSGRTRRFFSELNSLPKPVKIQVAETLRTYLAEVDNRYLIIGEEEEFETLIKKEFLDNNVHHFQ